MDYTQKANEYSLKNDSFEDHVAIWINVYNRG